MKRFYNFILLVVFGGFLYSCTYNEMVLPPGPVGPISFSSDVVPLFSKCTGCHGNAGGLDLKNDPYTHIMDGRVDMDNPENSLIYTKPHPDGSHSAKYTDYDAQVVLLWIQEGAENN